MVKYENRCCDCAAPAYPCKGSRCPLRSVPVHYCDNCGGEIEDAKGIEIDGQELCVECYEEQYD